MVANDFSDAGDFIRDVFRTMFDACRMPALFVPAITFSVAMDLAAAAANWPFREGLNPPTAHTITVFGWAWRAVGSTVGAGPAAALYYELIERAPGE